MTKRIFRSIITVALTVLLASLIMVVSFLYDYFNKSQINQLKEELSLVASNVEKIGKDYFLDFDSPVFRFTLVDSDGTVLHDTKASAQDMDNHMGREEIREAIEKGVGSSARYSSTLTERTLYEAVLLENGNILRVSVSRMTIGALIIGMLPAISAIILTAIIVSLVLSDKMAKRITDPLNSLDLENPTDNDAYEELRPILAKIYKQHKQIKRKADEFQQVSDSMSEGLILLDKNNALLSINPAAKRIFGIEDVSIGTDFLRIVRDAEICNAIDGALAGERSEFRQNREGREYQFVMNRIESDSKTVGTVILCFDITEEAFAERNRREFTANVSHELKTPLQSIIGCAELLETGLVKPEDTQRFIGNIKGEAVRLVSLINDIIRLSQLDENSELLTETVDLYEISGEVLDELSTCAEKMNVGLCLKGKSAIMNGIRRYLYEIVYNLCDNAIRYNVSGGKVTVEIKVDNGNPVITVSDTGIGIPIEHQPRIFERFYRVDKSHSKETGGTGLGLSIVKHAVSYHGGSIHLESAEGKGTVVIVTFSDVS